MTTTDQYKISGVDWKQLTEFKVFWHTGETSGFHAIWLRDNCRCNECYFDTTKQKLFSSCSLKDDIKATSVNSDGDQLTVIWDQGSHKSIYEAGWLASHSYNPKLGLSAAQVKEQKLLLRKYWKVPEIKNELPLVDFHLVIKSDDNSDNEDAIRDWCLKIWKFGFCLVDNVPVDPEVTARLCEKISYIKPTHYGGFWDFTSDLSKNDTAYTNIDISSHTDGTYWSDTPGLQLFHLLYHDGTGGTTTLVDAFQCAQEFEKRYPEDYALLSRLPVPAHAAGEEKLCIQPAVAKPIFTLGNHGELVQVRWNQADRSTLVDCEDPSDIPRFYLAIKKWNSIISDPENEIFHQMKPGQCLIFDNWRCFHSRTEFTGKRRLCGAYLNRDDYVSRTRLLNLGRDTVLQCL